MSCPRSSSRQGISSVQGAQPGRCCAFMTQKEATNLHRWADFCRHAPDEQFGTKKTRWIPAG